MTVGGARQWAITVTERILIMSLQWTSEAGTKYWIKTGNDYVELHLDRRGMQKRVDGLTRDQIKAYEDNPSLLLK